MDVAQPIEVGTLISRTPGIKGGTPHVAGTTITVRTIVKLYQRGLSPEEIIAEYPELNLAGVYAALAFYHANRSQMDAEIAAEQSDSDQIERAHLEFPQGKE